MGRSSALHRVRNVKQTNASYGAGGRIRNGSANDTQLASCLGMEMEQGPAPTTTADLYRPTPQRGLLLAAEVAAETTTFLGFQAFNTGWI